MTPEAAARDLPLPDEELDDLRARYGAKGRHYHDWSHIEALFAQADGVKWHDREAVHLALLYHDVIYRPGRSDNEEESARLMEARLKGRAAPGRLAFAGDLIRWTATHAVPDGLEPERLADAVHMLDIDMGILGAPRKAYERYAGNVRREFRRIPAPIYRRGRAKVLAEFLKRPRLYLSERFHAELDAAARDNIRWELGHALGRAGRRALGP